MRSSGRQRECSQLLSTAEAIACCSPLEGERRQAARQSEIPPGPPCEESVRMQRVLAVIGRVACTSVCACRCNAVALTLPPHLDASRVASGRVSRCDTRSHQCSPI